MTESETRAYKIIKKKPIRHAPDLAKEMGCSRQYAHDVIKSLKAKEKIIFEPARWRIK